LIQKVSSLLHKNFFFVIRCLFWWDWGDDQARISTEQNVFELKELSEPSENVYLTQTVAALHVVGGVLASPRALYFHSCDVELHNSIIALDFVDYGLSVRRGNLRNLILHFLE